MSHQANSCSDIPPQGLRGEWVVTWQSPLSHLCPHCEYSPTYSICKLKPISLKCFPRRL